MVAHECVAGAEEEVVLAGGSVLTLSSVVGVTAGEAPDDEEVGAASFLGGIRSLAASRPLASANELILWLGEKPATAAKQREECTC